MKPWYEITNRINQTIDVELHNEIGRGGVTAAEFIKELNSHHQAKSINLSIHSPGGNMLDGFAMFNALKKHPAKVFSHVAGIAASAASTVLMAGDVITMPEDAFIMIHNPMGAVVGGSEEMRDYAAVMDKLKVGAVNIYAKKTGKTARELSVMMNEETWMDSDDALKHGFIDSITNPVGVANKLNVFNKHFKIMPFESNGIINRINSVKNAYQYEKLLVEAGISYESANLLTNKIKEIVQAKDTDNKHYQSLELAIASLRIRLSGVNSRLF